MNYSPLLRAIKGDATLFLTTGFLGVLASWRSLNLLGALKNPQIVTSPRHAHGRDARVTVKSSQASSVAARNLARVSEARSLVSTFGMTVLLIPTLILFPGVR